MSDHEKKPHPEHPAKDPITPADDTSGDPTNQNEDGSDPGSPTPPPPH